MFKPLELYIGLRYTRAKRRNHFISFISLISMVGMALGVTALITVLSVMNGFEKELRERILGMTSHATVLKLGQPLHHWQGVAEVIQHHPRILGLIVAVAAFNIISTLVMVVTDKQADVAILRTLRLTPRNIMGIFIVQGTIIGLVGTLLGVAGGVW